VLSWGGSRLRAGALSLGYYDTPKESAMCIKRGDGLILRNTYVILTVCIKIHIERYCNGKGKRVTLSLSADTKENLEKFAKQNGMTQSGLVSFLINQLDKTAKGDIFK
jgi:hypothetical protein